MTANNELYPEFPAKPICVVLCGVGGQGAITAAHLLAGAAMHSGYDVKVSEIHGMAQRGGSVSTTVRFGQDVATMVCDPGCADLLISFETMEALRNLEYLKADGHVIVNDTQIIPMPVLSGLAKMPEDVEGTLKSYGEDAITLFDAEEVAEQAGNRKCSNMALLGCAATYLPITEEAWHKAIEGRVPPKTLDANLKAFALAQGK